MRNLIRGLIAMVLLSFGSAVYAANCSELYIEGVEGAALQTARAACQQAVAEAARTVEGVTNLPSELTDPNKMTAWGQVAQEWAKALGIAANELGIAVDNFLNTTAGKMTAALLIWHIAGESILGIVIGVPLLIVVLTVGIKIARSFRIKEIVYREKRNWIGRRVVDKIVLSEDNDNAVGVLLTAIATTILSIWIVAGIILP